MLLMLFVFDLSSGMKFYLHLRNPRITFLTTQGNMPTSCAPDRCPLIY